MKHQVVYGCIAGIAAGVLFFLLPWYAALGLVVIFYFVLNDKILSKASIAYMTFAVLLILYMMNLIHFALMPQVEFLAKFYGPLDILDPKIGQPYTGESHVFRYIVASPALLFSYLLKVSADVVYNIYCIAIFSVFAFLFERIAHICIPNILLVKRLVLAAVSILALIMNGRIIFAYLGIAIILYLQLKNLRGVYHGNGSYLVLSIIGFLLGSVSSGTLTIIFTQYLIGAWYYRERNIFVRLLPTLLFLPHLVAMIKKNIQYFGGGLESLINMVSHGYGFFGFGVDIYVVIILILILGMLCIAPLYQGALYFLQQRAENFLLLVSVLVSLLFGVYGLSTATMAFPGLLILTGEFCTDLIRQGKGSVAC